MKKFISFILVLIIVFSIAFQCSTTSYAIAGVDDVVVLGVCLDLLALGITIHSVKDFCKSDTFHDFCTDIGNHVDSGISAVKRSGKLFLATTKLAWNDICNWVKRHFSGVQETKTIEYETEEITTPQTITLSDGGVVPYSDFMEYPFMIFKSPANGNYCAIYCTNNDCGAEIRTSVVQIYCTGTGKVGRYDFVNGDWNQMFLNNMTYGATYKGVQGSIYNFNFATGTNVVPESFWLYRTMDRISNTNGDIATQYPPATTVPDGVVEGTATVTASSDPLYYPGSVDAPTTVIQDDELILIEVPEELVVDSNTSNPSLTTDIDTIGDSLSVTTPVDVNPRVLTQTGSVSGTVDQVITDTPSVDLEAGVNDPSVDIETANKFRLPRSFLEGFPFSIPYSIYVGIQSFLAEPQAPYFEFPFSIPAIGIEQHMVVDLSQWNALARLCRALLSLVWVAGLAMACHRFIKR